MSRLSIAGSLIAAIVFGLSSLNAQPQAAPEPINIVTADGVKLKAMFYRSSMNSAPTVIMLHPIGEGKSMKTPEWKILAETLQKANYSVMMFDFRGHGDSTSIEDPNLFWNVVTPEKNFPNLTNVKPKDPKVKDEIDVKDYIKRGGAYLPVLVNDIAAVRSYLDRRNDDIKDCNTSSIIVIGADTGATLGALWINSEWHRYKYSPDTTVPPAIELTKAKNFTDCAGKDIIGAVFLTIQPKFESRTVSVSKLLNSSCGEYGMAAAFFSGKEDEKATNQAKALEKALKQKGKKHDYIGAVPLNTNLSGTKLLTKGLGTETLIAKYLDNFIEERTVPRVQRDFAETNYRWKFVSGAGFTSIPARQKKGDKTLIFDDYIRFLPK